MILFKKIFLCVFLTYLTIQVGCRQQSPVEETGPYFDKNIPPSEDFNASYGTWNSDGTKIAFQHDEPFDSSKGNIDQLWVLNTQTGERKKLIDGKVNYIDWAPNDEWLLFNTILGASKSAYLYKIKTNGNELTQLTGGDSPNNLAYTVGGNWSPSGSKILFTIVAGEPRGVTLMNSDGTDYQIVKPYGVAANWFPNGNKFTYINWDTSIEDESKQRQVYISNIDGTNEIKLTNLENSTFLSYPTVSPDNQHFAFTHLSRSGQIELFIMELDGTNIKQMTSGDGIVLRPEWHPNGQTILFTRFIPNNSERLYLINIQNKEVIPLFPSK